jgi:threonine dehydrogenase-like Zn-dependent dehydrogenase
MLRDGGTYIEMGQFTDAGPVSTNWHRICTKDITIIGSWGFTADDIWTGIVMLDRARNRYPFRDMQTHFPFTEAGIADAVAGAREMRCVKATIVPRPDLLDV